MVSDKLSLLLGARYDKIMYNYRSFLTAPPVRQDSKKFSRVTPKLGINWLLSQTQSVYANLGGGIEAPAGNETDPTPGAPPALLNPLLDPIKSTTIEVGTKSRPSLAGKSFALGYEVAVYNIAVQNEVVPYNGGRYYLTAAEARRQGVELGLNAEASTGLFANAAITLANNKYLDYVVDSAVIFPTDPTKVGKTADYSDNKVVGVPDIMANIEVGMDFANTFRVKFGVENSGEYFADDANTVEVPSYTIFNATAELRKPIRATSGWGISGFVSVRNLTDKHFIGSAFLNPDLVVGVPAAFEPGMPRAVIVSLSLGRLR
jgi:iron complex outermembrane receptor protein